MSDTGRPSPSAPPVSVIRPVTFLDADHASCVIGSAYADVCLEPLTAGPFDMTTSGVALQGLQLYRSHSASGVRFTRVAAYDGFSFTSLQGGRAVFGTGATKHAISGGMAVALDAGTVDGLELGAHSAFTGLAVTTATLQDALSDRLGRAAARRIAFDRNPQPKVVRSAYESLAAVLVSGLCDDGHLRDNPLAVAHLRDALITMILHGTLHAETAALAMGTVEAPATVRRALDYIYAHAHCPITTTDIARDLGIGIRSLQLSFRRWRGTTPHQSLRQARLELARRDLLAGAPASVGSISRKWGFNAPGEFARLYRDAFGELPLQTLARKGHG